MTSRLSDVSYMITGRVMSTYSTILADPNWTYSNFGAAMHGAARGHYECSSTAEIASIPVASWARKDSTLLLWATLPKLDCAIDVMRAWGFSLVTSLPWVKMVPSRSELAKGIGFWFYSTTEMLLICRRGNSKAPKYASGAEKPDGLLVGECAQFYARRGVHSAKPLSLIEWIDAYLPGPKLELFARSARAGWDCWGHETGFHLDSEGVSIIG